MVTGMEIKILIGIAMTAFVIYGLLNEQKFIDFEDKVMLWAAKKIVARRHKKALAQKRAAQAARRNKELQKEQLRLKRAKNAGIYINVA